MGCLRQGCEGQMWVGDTFIKQLVSYDHCIGKPNVMLFTLSYCGRFPPGGGTSKGLFLDTTSNFAKVRF